MDNLGLSPLPNGKPKGWDSQEPGAYVDLHNMPGRVERVDQQHVKYFMDLSPGKKQAVTRKVDCIPGGTTGRWRSRRTRACGWSTSSPRNRWPCGVPAPKSTGRNARAQSRPIMRR